MGRKRTLDHIIKHVRDWLSANREPGQAILPGAAASTADYEAYLPLRPSLGPVLPLRAGGPATPLGGRNLQRKLTSRITAGAKVRKCHAHKLDTLAQRIDGADEFKAGRMQQVAAIDGGGLRTAASRLLKVGPFDLHRHGSPPAD